MKYLLPIILTLLSLVVASPWIMAIVDMYHYFFFGATLSGITYMADRIPIICISVAITIPTVTFLLVNISILEERKIRER
jgi:hypothetical protein